MAWVELKKHVARVTNNMILKLFDLNFRIIIKLTGRNGTRKAEKTGRRGQKEERGGGEETVSTN